MSALSVRRFVLPPALPVHVAAETGGAGRPTLRPLRTRRRRRLFAATLKASGLRSRTECTHIIICASLLLPCPYGFMLVLSLSNEISCLCSRSAVHQPAPLYAHRPSSGCGHLDKCVCVSLQSRSCRAPDRDGGLKAGRLQASRRQVVMARTHQLAAQRRRGLNSRVQRGRGQTGSATQIQL